MRSMTQIAKHNRYFYRDYCRRISLDDLRDWIDEELSNQHIRKANKLYRIFCKYAKLRYPYILEEELRAYTHRNWD